MSEVPGPPPGADAGPLPPPGPAGPCELAEPGRPVTGPGGRPLLRVLAPVEVLQPDRPVGAPSTWTRAERDRWAVEVSLGRPPRSTFAVAVRDAATGDPVVIRNPPLLADGTPMPTRWWLLAFGPEVGALEADGGVQAAIGDDALAAAHRRAAAERDGALPAGHVGPRPTGGVGGTRRGVKCLHAHYAAWLATGDDPVGAWVHERLVGPTSPAVQPPR